MASYSNVQTVSLIAGADLSAAQYLFVKADTTDGQVVLCGDGENAIGVLVNAPASGEAAVVAISGLQKVKVAAGGVTGGGIISCAASGLCTNSANGDYSLGTALDDGSAGEIIRVLFNPMGVDPA